MHQSHHGCQSRYLKDLSGGTTFEASKRRFACSKVQHVEYVLSKDEIDVDQRRLARYQGPQSPVSIRICEGSCN